MEEEVVAVKEDRDEAAVGVLARLLDRLLQDLGLGAGQKGEFGTRKRGDCGLGIRC